jgi:hypothetical protein
MLVTVPLRLAQPDSINDGGVVQGVRDDGILLTKKSLKDSSIRVKAGNVENGILCAMEPRDLPLEILVDVLGATDEPDRAETNAMRLKSLHSSLLDLGMIAESKIVVGTEVEDGGVASLDSD